MPLLKAAMSLKKSFFRSVRSSARSAIFLFFLIACAALLFAASSSAGTPCEWNGVEKIVAVGDIHGDYENFAVILKGTGIVDEELHWIAGKTHFVQTGDVMDRGPDARKILDLLMLLEKEAEQAGGKVHVLIGNHEEMNITGIAFRNPDYVTVDQFISFLPEGYKKSKERELEKKIRALRIQGKKSQEEAAVSEFWNALRNDPSGRREYLRNFSRDYGSWILKQNAVIKINDTVFVHGGISEKFSKRKLEDINNQLRLELGDSRRAILSGSSPMIARPEVVYNEEGPLWYRELATVPEEDMGEEVDRILANLGAKHMVIAHTPRIRGNAEDMTRFDKKIWIIDTGIAHVYRGYIRALIIQNGDFYVWEPKNEKDENPILPFTDALHYRACLSSAAAGLS